MLLRFVLCVITLLVSIGCVCVTATGDGGPSALASTSNLDSNNCPPDSSDGHHCTHIGDQHEGTPKECEGSTAGGQCPNREEGNQHQVNEERKLHLASSAHEKVGDELVTMVSQTDPNTVRVGSERGENLDKVNLENQNHDESGRGKTPLTPEDRTHRGPTQSEDHVQAQAQQSAQQGIPGSPQPEESSAVVSNPTSSGEQETQRNDNTLNTESSPQTNPHQQENAELQSSVIAGAETPASPSPAETENTNASDNANAGSVSTSPESESTNNTATNTETPTTTTTTTTTTLPPELTNNKKGDADSSSSSISSSVWVRVSLLIVVTLACILVC